MEKHLQHLLQLNNGVILKKENFVCIHEKFRHFDFLAGKATKLFCSKRGYQVLVPVS